MAGQEVSAPVVVPVILEPSVLFYCQSDLHLQSCNVLGDSSSVVDVFLETGEMSFLLQVFFFLVGASQFF